MGMGIKKMRVHFLILLFLGSLIFAQNKNASDIEVKYLYSFSRDTTNLNERIEEIMILDLNSNSSIYYSDAFLQRRRSLEAELANAKATGQMAEINAGSLAKPKVDYLVFRDKDKTTVTSRIGRDYFSFETEPLKWSTHYKDEKEILGYKCKKAVTIFNKREYIAWYTSSIPISEGPYRFKGLPGVILDIQDTKGYDKFKAIAITKKQIEISSIQNGIPVTRNEYLKKREEFKNNPTPGKAMDISKRTQLENAIKKFNNTLER